MERLVMATEFLTSAIATDRRADALAGATPYLRLFGLAAGGTLLAKGALHAVASGASGADGSWISLARFFAENLVDETAALATTVRDGAAALHTAGKAHLIDAYGQA
jgi:hypothetical protein